MPKGKSQRQPRRRAAELLEELKARESRLTNQVYKQNTDIVYLIGSALMKSVEFNFLELEPTAEADLREMNDKGKAIIKDITTKIALLQAEN